jgi:hypothetical protein
MEVLLQPAKSDSETALQLKRLIAEKGSTEELEKFINREELLRVTVPIVSASKNDNTIDPHVQGAQRAQEIMESLRGDGRFFKQLIAAISFVEKRRHSVRLNVEALRSKYTGQGNSRRRRSTKKSRKTRSRRSV